MAKPMTKTQLVAALAEKMGSDKKSAGEALDAIVGIITDEVSGGGAVTLPGVGKIYCRERPARMVRNPIQPPASKSTRTLTKWSK
jgi:DNA-binding protein HU-beta